MFNKIIYRIIIVRICNIKIVSRDIQIFSFSSGEVKVDLVSLGNKRIYFIKPNQDPEKEFPIASVLQRNSKWSLSCSRPDLDKIEDTLAGLFQLHWTTRKMEEVGHLQSRMISTDSDGETGLWKRWGKRENTRGRGGWWGAEEECGGGTNIGRWAENMVGPGRADVNMRVKNVGRLGWHKMMWNDSEWWICQ